MVGTDSAENEGFDDAFLDLIGGFGLGLLAAFVGMVPVAGTFLVAPIASVFVAACIVVGTVGVAGVALGYAGVTLLWAGSSMVLGVSLVSYSAAAVVATVLWHGFGVTERAPVDPSWRRAARGVAALSVGATAGGVVMAWLYAAVGARPFYLALRYVAALWLSLLVFVPVLVYVMRRFDPEQGPTLSDLVVPREFRDVDAAPSIVGITLAWGVLGVIYSIGYRSLELVIAESPNALGTFGLEFLLAFHDDALYGVGGRRVQGALGGAMFVLLAIASVRAIRAEPLTDADTDASKVTTGSEAEPLETGGDPRDDEAAVERNDPTARHPVEFDRRESEQEADP